MERTPGGAHASQPVAPQAASGTNSPTGAPIPVPLLDVNRQFAPLRGAIQAAIEKVCESGRFIMGPDCEQLEKSVAAYCAARHAVACASGSDALLLALMALEVGPGHEVILPSYTFFATASAVWRLGAVPVFVDIEPRSFNIDPALVEQAISPATRAIIPVHLFGQCAEMNPLCELARTHGIAVIEDAAQAIGARYHGRSAGTLGDIGCFSFYPTKNLGCFGDGGMLVTQNDELAARLRLLRAHGMEPRYYHQVVGINSRLDTLQAAVLNVKLPHLDNWAAARAANAQRYRALFAAAPLDKIITTPPTLRERAHVWNQFVIRVAGGERDALRQHLTECQIGTEIYYPVPLHEQACFRSLGYKTGSLPESERAAHETLALPIFPELTPDEQQRVVKAIVTFFALRGVSLGSSVRPPKFIQRQAEGAAGQRRAS